MIALALTLSLAAMAAIEPDVRGVGRCPSPDEVARRLGPLLSPGGQLPAGAWLEIAEPARAGGPGAASGEIEVRMMTGTPPTALGARRLSVPASCDEAAQAVAVIAASWMASYQSPPLLWFGEPPPGPEVAPIAPPAPTSETKTPPPASPPGAAVTGEVHTGGAAANSQPLALEVGADLGLAAATAGTAAPFLIAEVDLRRWSASGARLLAMAVGARTIDLGAGQVAWRRLMAGVGVSHTWGAPSVHLQAGVDVMAGATFIEGSGFAQNAASTSFDAAAGPWVRAGARLAAAPVTVWLGAQGLAWARAQQVQVDGVASRDTLPRLDLLVGTGLTWTLDPAPSQSSSPLKQ